MKSNIFKKAHELTKNIIKKGDNYRATFKLCLSFVYSQIKKGVVKMIELKGTEKQVKWANDIREKVFEYEEELLRYLEDNSSKKVMQRKKKVVDYAYEKLRASDDSVSIIMNFKSAFEEIKKIEEYKKYLSEKGEEFNPRGYMRIIDKIFSAGLNEGGEQVLL